MPASWFARARDSKISSVVERRRDVDRGVRRYVGLGCAGGVWEGGCDGLGEGTAKSCVDVVGKREVWRGLFWFGVNH